MEAGTATWRKAESRVGLRRAMIDNFNLADSIEAVDRSRGKLKLEASGGIDEASILEIARTGVDYISVGELTKDVTPLDLSMRFVATPSD